MKRSQGMFVQQWRRTGTLNAHIEETFSGHALVKVFGRQAEAERVFAEQNEELYEASFGAQFVSGLIMPIMMFVGNLNYVVIAVLGGLRVASGTMSLGEVQAFIQYSRQFTQPLTQVASMINLLQSGVASAERVFELLDAPEEDVEADRDCRRPPTWRAARCASRTCRSPTTRSAPLISGLSLVAEPGPDGRDRRADRRRQDDAGQPGDAVLRPRRRAGSLSTASTSPRCRAAVLRGQIGMVLQDTWLFAGTIRDNIAYGRPDASEEEILEAARATFVDRFVHSLPDGYDTVIDEEGSNLSAGERQLMTIARAFLTQPGAADPRRGDLVGRHPHRAAAAAGDGGAAHRPHLLRDRPPALHDPRRRPDPGDGGRRDRRAGLPRGAARGRTGRTPGSTARSSTRPRTWRLTVAASE